ncbi:MAG: CBS domain-containing protein [Magnetospirillum sp.]|nr:CBS domain-containing protein [Magnetospirillum sp.]
MRPLPLSDLMTRSVVTVPPGTTMAEALRLMSERRISCLVVAEAGRAAGIVTERDVVKRFVGLDGHLDQPVTAIMTAAPMTVPETTDHFEAFKLMKANGFRHLVVATVDGAIAGVVTETDFIRHLGIDFYLRPKDVLSVMAPAISIDGAAPLGDAIALLGRHGAFCVFVEEQGRAVGILTERDIVRLLQADEHSTRVGAAMSAPLETVTAGSSLLDASEILRRRGFRHLAVVDDCGRAIGVVGEHEIVKGLESEYVVHLEHILAEKEAALEQLRQTHEALSRQSQALAEAVAALTTTHEDLSEMARVAVHDLQEPTRVVVGFSQMLLKRHGDQLGPEVQDLLQYVIDGTLRMSRQVHDLSAYALAAVAGTHAEPVDAGEIARTAVASMGEEIGNLGAVVDIGVLPAVRMQRPALLLLFEHLIANALRYRHPEAPPEIRIRGEEQAEGVLLWVGDNGIGIDPVYHERIFGLFTRLAPSSKDATGAGLAICRRVVAAVGGRIWVQSSPGDGSTFFISLPRGR